MENEVIIGRDICNVYGKGVIGEQATQKWFARFKNGDLDLEDTLQSGRPSEFDEEHLKALLKEDGRQTPRDEKWCLYLNMKPRKEWLAPGDIPKPRIRQDLHPQKAMICVFWDCEGVLYWEMLKRNATVNKDLYIAQFHHMNEAIQQKRPDRQGQIILLHDNVRSHVAQVVKAALQEFKWEVLQHPPYSPDLATTDYHLFRSMSYERHYLRCSKPGSTTSLTPDRVFLAEWIQ
ncbi:hypothetical protein LAZ67_23001258 [Cordylochernes scorpioides]|uniref:Mos1 transposase HTH domain-containing protein n=1 Tax=Cordylochernes scorpioides TaxID=51811 RepID=A0ABY6LT47_9ARAC|nr:hypothetical protein LAZ67_23001258 [Cordylochernes scorpioides]